MTINGDLQFPVCVMGSNSQGRNHDLYGASLGSRLNQAEKSALKQYLMAIYSTYKNAKSGVLPCDFMGLFPLGEGGKTRWCLAHTRVDSRTATGVLTQTIGVLLEVSDLRLGHPTLSAIYAALIQQADGVEREAPSALAVERPVHAYELSRTFLDIAAVRQGRLTGIYLSEPNPDSTSPHFQWFDANFILYGVWPSLSTSPQKIVGDDGWSLGSNLLIVSGEAAPPKGYIKLQPDDRGWKAPKLGLDADQSDWCNICFDMAEAMLSFGAAREKYAPLSIKMGLIAMLRQIDKFDHRRVFLTFAGLSPDNVPFRDEGRTRSITDAFRRFVKYAQDAKNQKSVQRRMGLFLSSFKEMDRETIQKLPLTRIITATFEDWVCNNTLSSNDDHLIFNLALEHSLAGDFAQQRHNRRKED